MKARLVNRANRVSQRLERVRTMERELEAVLRAASARSLSATAGGTNYAAQAKAVVAYLERIMCAECRDDTASVPVLLSSDLLSSDHG